MTMKEAASVPALSVSGNIRDRHILRNNHLSLIGATAPCSTNQSHEHLLSPTIAPGKAKFMNQSEFDSQFQFIPPKTFSLRIGHRFHKCTGCIQSGQNFVKFITSYFTILQWLPNYSWRFDLAGDFMAGITLGVVHVPQGIAYAILAGVDPVFGLYSCFFGVVFYMIFGTSKHVSIGTMAIVSMMTATSCRDIYQRMEQDYLTEELKALDYRPYIGPIINPPQHRPTEGEDQSPDNEVNRYFGNISQLVAAAAPHILRVQQIELVQMITLTSGLVQIAMAILRVEFLASYLSDQLVNAFCTGAALHVVIAQLERIGQLRLNTKHSGPGYLIWILRDVILESPRTNWIALGISIFTFLFLYYGKEHLNQKMRKHVPMPIPFELLLMILATVVSTVGNFKDNHGIEVVNKVPTGLPAIRLPRLELFPYVLDDSLRIAFVVVALHLSLCKVFNRGGIKTDNNMELYALGLTGSLSSFFGTYPVCSALGRSMLNTECGVKTQFSSVFSSLLLLFVILFIGPLLSDLPMCVLSALIIYSVKNVFVKMPREILHLWRVSKIDFLIWAVTFLATVSLNVMQGLVVSVAFALMTTVFRIQWPRWYILSNLAGTDYYRDSGRYKKITPLEDGIKIFRFDAPLLFTNVEHFSNSIFKALKEGTSKKETYNLFNSRQKTAACWLAPPNHNQSGASQQLLLLTPPCTTPTTAHSFQLSDNKPNGNACSKLAEQEQNRDEKSSVAINQIRRASVSPLKQKVRTDVRTLIIDCTGFTFVDYTSVNALADLYHQVTDFGVDVLFAHAKAPIRDMLEVCDFFNSVPRSHFFPTTHDAVLAAQNKKKWRRRKRGASESLKKSSSVLNEDTNSLCVGEKEFFLSSFKNLNTLTNSGLLQANEDNLYSAAPSGPGVWGVIEEMEEGGASASGSADEEEAGFTIVEATVTSDLSALGDDGDQFLAEDRASSVADKSSSQLNGRNPKKIYPPPSNLTSE